MAILTRRPVLSTFLARGTAGTLPLPFDVENDGMTPERAISKAFKRAIFAKYTIVAS
jgi:hypothetical protein